MPERKPCVSGNEKTKLLDFMLITKNTACRMCGSVLPNGAKTVYQLRQCCFLTTLDGVHDFLIWGACGPCAHIGRGEGMDHLRPELRAGGPCRPRIHAAQLDSRSLANNRLECRIFRGVRLRRRTGRPLDLPCDPRASRKT